MDGGVAAHPGAQAYGVLDFVDKYLSVPDLALGSIVENDIDALFQVLVAYHTDDHHPGLQDHGLFGAPVPFGIAFLQARALYGNDGDAGHVRFL